MGVVSGTTLAVGSGFQTYVAPLFIWIPRARAISVFFCLYMCGIYVHLSAKVPAGKYYGMDGREA